jgi:hypothetical protein
MFPQNYGTVSQAPDLVGAYGRAWRIPMAPLGHRGRPDADATVAGWLMFVPSAHAFWTYWAAFVVHLRPIEGVRPAHISEPGATHELMIMALNPEQPLPDLAAVGRGEASFAWLMPIDQLQQFTVNDDAQAAQLLELAVRSCVDGYASPDQDWRGRWRQMIPATAAHLREGKHPETRA